MSLIYLFAFALSTSHASTAVSSPADQYVSKANELKLSEQKQWVNLLHHRRNVLGLKRSQIKGENFFLSPTGYKDTQAELEATIRGLLSKESFKEDEHPICVFPARKRWLQEKLNIPEQEFPKASCYLYDRYIKRLNADSVSMIFSSYYANSPGSAFGHTLFRVNQKVKAGEERNELLDHGLGFAANVNTSNPVIYALFGILGGFNGTYTNVPYYFKVREYNDFESRALWSYDLNLTPPEVVMLVDHLWEVGGTEFSYYFYTQNCAFHMLTVMQAAIPRLSVADDVRFYVIPAEAIRVSMEEEGLITNVTFRPSAKEKFETRWANLSDEEQDIFREWRKTRQPNSITEKSIGDARKIALLDAALDYFDFKFPRAEPNSAEVKQRNLVLGTRAKIPLPSEPLKVEPPHHQRPDKGHTTARVNLAVGVLDSGSKESTFEEFRVRFALHDLLDVPIGYPENSVVEFMDFKFRYFNDPSKFQMEDFKIFSLLSLAPLKEFSDSPSWGLLVGGRRFYDKRCFNCFGFAIDGHYGLSGSFLGEKLLTYGLLKVSAVAAPKVEHSDGYLSAGPVVGAVFAFSNYTRFKADWTNEFALFRHAEHLGEQRFELRQNFGLDWSIGLQYLKRPDNTEATFNLYKFM